MYGAVVAHMLNDGDRRLRFRAITPATQNVRRTSMELGANAPFIVVDTDMRGRVVLNPWPHSPKQSESGKPSQALPALRLCASAAASGNSTCVMLPRNGRSMNDQKHQRCLSF
jgi:hypothetical protein